MPDTRIPIEDFADFNRCRINGYTAGIRWITAMDAYEQHRLEARKAALDNRAGPVDWRDVYVVGWAQSH